MENARGGIPVLLAQGAGMNVGQHRDRNQVALAEYWIQSTYCKAYIITATSAISIHQHSGAANTPLAPPAASYNRIHDGSVNSSPQGLRSAHRAPPNSAPI